MRGLEVERILSDPYFYLLYEQASALDLPVCVHSANGAFTTYDFSPMILVSPSLN
jgi:predicted TIM-barrel fold metal-dependent hydrolase